MRSDMHSFAGLRTLPPLRGSPLKRAPPFSQAPPAGLSPTIGATMYVRPIFTAYSMHSNSGFSRHSRAPTSIAIDRHGFAIGISLSDGGFVHSPGARSLASAGAALLFSTFTLSRSFATAPPSPELTTPVGACSFCLMQNSLPIFGCVITPS